MRQCEDGGDVIVPHERSFRDYVIRMGETIHLVAQAEAITSLALLRKVGISFTVG